MKKLFATLICAVMCITLLVSCDKECVHTKGYWEHDENSHWQPYTCSLNKCDLEPSVKVDHVDENEDSICDVCSYQIPQHEHTYQEHQDEIGHSWSYTCGCMTPPNFAQHADGDGDGKCDDCEYVMNENITNTGNTKNLCGHTSSIQKADADVFDSGVFYAGYYTADSLTENSLNFDKLANSRLDRALIYKFDTYEEYNAFKAQYEENLNFELLSYITNDYFEENTLVLAYEIVNNSTYRYTVSGIYIEKEKICVHIKETTNAEFVDWAMSGWFFAVTIDKTITADITEYDAIIEE